MNRRMAIAALGAILVPWASACPRIAAQGATPPAGHPTPLLAVTIPGAMLPPGEGIVGFFQLEIAPGTVVPVRAGVPLGTDVLLLVSGSLAIAFDAPTPLLLPDTTGTPTAAATPTTTVTLGPGEAIAFPTAAPREFRNDGTTPAVLLAVTLSAPNPPPTDLPAGYTFQALGFLEPSAWATLPEGAVTVTLERTAQVPGETAGAGTLQIVAPAVDEPGTYLLVITPAAPDRGTPTG